MGVDTISVLLIAAMLGGCVQLGDIPAAPQTSGRTTSGDTTGADTMTNQTTPLDFKRITLTERGMVAEIFECELLHTADGVTATNYMGRWDYIDGLSREDCIHEQTQYGAELYPELAAKLGEIVTSDWDGFSGYDPMVLDGISFSLEIERPDGSIIYARGTNAFPENFDKFRSLLHDATQGKID